MANRFAKIALVGLFVVGSFSYASAQQSTRDLADHIKTETEQTYILARCAGYFKALAIQNAEADQRLVSRAEDTIKWFFDGIVKIEAKSDEGNMGQVGLDTAESINNHAQFYLDRMIDNIAGTGQPFDQLIATDQQVCVIMASMRNSQ